MSFTSPVAAGISGEGEREVSVDGVREDADIAQIGLAAVGGLEVDSNVPSEVRAGDVSSHDLEGRGEGEGEGEGERCGE